MNKFMEDKVEKHSPVHEKLPHEVSKKSTNEIKEKKVLNFFKIMKLGQSGWSYFAKPRIMVIIENCLNYYEYPEKTSNEMVKRLLKDLEENYPSDSKTKQDQKEPLKQKITEEEFNTNIKKYLKLKESISLDQLDIESDQSKNNVKNFKYCVILKEKTETNEKEQVKLYQEMDKEVKKDKDKTKNKEKENKKVWIVDFIMDTHFSRFEREIDDKKKQVEKKGKRDKKQDKIQAHIDLKDDKVAKVENKQIEKEIDSIFMLYVYDIIYQYLLKEHYGKKDELKKKFELIILHIIGKFKEICSVLVRKIILDMISLKANKSSGNSFLPLILPVNKCFEKPETSILIYHIYGINFHLTWNEIMLEKSKNFDKKTEEFISNGAWNSVDLEFKCRDLYNEVNTKYFNHQPKVPLSCVVEYCGFKVFCEYDVWTYDEQNSKGNSNDQKKSQAGNINSKEEKDQTISTLITTNPKQFFLAYKKAKNSENNSNSKQSDYEKKFLEYFYDSFKKYEELFCNDSILPNVDFNSSSTRIEYTMSRQNASDTGGAADASIGGDTSAAKYTGSTVDQEFYKYFENKESNKDFGDLKYNFELKNLFENTVTTFDSKIDFSPTRKIYFRPEFIHFYIKKMNLNNENEIKKRMKNLFEGNADQKNSNLMGKHLKEEHLNSFISSLDSFYLKPYDSQTLTECFHNYGINMFYLGHVAESTSVPFVRELCIIEMIARICKKFLINIISQKWFRKFYDEIYYSSNNFKSEKIDYIKSIPYCFQVKYKDYLSDGICIPSFEISDSREKKLKNVYKKHWFKCNDVDDKFMNELIPKTQPQSEQKFNDLFVKPNESIFNDISKSISSFFSVLFNFGPKKTFYVEILKQKYSNTELWKKIKDELKNHYFFTHEDVVKYSEPLYLSLPALYNSILYHVGLTSDLHVVNNTKFVNKDLKDKDFSTFRFNIKYRVKSYCFRNFSWNKPKSCKIHYDLNFDQIDYSVNKELIRTQYRNIYAKQYRSL